MAQEPLDRTPLVSEYIKRARKAFPWIGASLLAAAVVSGSLGIVLDSRPIVLAVFYFTGFAFFGFIADALRTGLTVTVHYSLVERSSDPTLFWMMLGLQALMGAMMLWIAVMDLNLRAG